MGSPQDPQLRPRDAPTPYVFTRRTHRTLNTSKTGRTQEPLWQGRQQEYITAVITMTYRRASTQRLVASSTANTALCSALSRISHVPVNSCASRPPSPCTATTHNFRSTASVRCAPYVEYVWSGGNRIGSAQVAVAR